MRNIKSAIMSVIAALPVFAADAAKPAQAADKNPYPLCEDGSLVPAVFDSKLKRQVYAQEECDPVEPETQLQTMPLVGAIGIQGGITGKSPDVEGADYNGIGMSGAISGTILTTLPDLVRNPEPGKFKGVLFGLRGEAEVFRGADVKQEGFGNLTVDGHMISVGPAVRFQHDKAAVTVFGAVGVAGSETVTVDNNGQSFDFDIKNAKSVGVDLSYELGNGWEGNVTGKYTRAEGEEKVTGATNDFDMVSVRAGITKKFDLGTLFSWEDKNGR